MRTPETASEAIEHYAQIYKNEAETYSHLAGVHTVRAKLKQCLAMLKHCDHLSECSTTKAMLRRAICLWREAIYEYNGEQYSNDRDTYYWLENGEEIENFTNVFNTAKWDDLEEIEYLFN